MPSPILAVRNLRKDYDKGRIEALQRSRSHLSTPGEFVAISGSSGSGKSTLLQLLGGLDTPTSGEVLFKGTALGSSISLDSYRCHQVGFIFQSFYLLPTLRAIENVQAPMLATSEGSGERVQRRAERTTARSRTGIPHVRQYPNELSGGERQRVAIARALANNPSILLADEPTGNLDSTNSARIMEILTGIQKTRGMTLIVITHENEIANSAPRHIRIHDGRIVS